MQRFAFNMKLFSFFGVCLWQWSFITASPTLESEQVILRGIRGLDAVLPCGQGKVFLDGPDSYVLWMKNNKQLLYRYPDGDSSFTSIQTFDQAFGPPCKEDSCVDPTSLRLKRIGESDGGIYSCRVHYQASPAVDFAIELRVVDSPGTPKIFNSDGFDLSGSVRQLSLGSNLTLICEVKDDQQGTLVWWERNGIEIARAESVQDGVLRTMVQIIKADRNELDAHYECLAQNADVTDPLSASVVIKMYLPPMSVEIRLNNNLDFEAGLPRVVDCVVVGCVPPPTITWHLGNTMLRPSVHKELHDGNFTVSSLTLAPSLRDDKNELTCRAHNSHLPREVFENKVVVNVGFRPVCLNDHEEVIGYVAGQTERVTCMVEAYPEPMQFSWTFADTKTLYTSVKKVAGHQHRYSSSLTWNPQDHDKGELLCRATNVLGEQKRPCVYSIVPGGPPSTPNCELTNTEPKTIKISCKKNWDGGRPQTIHLEVLKSGNSLQNVTDSYGHFAVPQLQERNLTAIVYASNSRGRSELNVLQLAPTMNNTTNDNEDKHKNDALIGAVIGTIVFGTLVGVLARCIKYLQDKKMDIAESSVQIDPEANLPKRPDDPRTQVQGSYFRHAQPHLPRVEHPCPNVAVKLPFEKKVLVTAYYRNRDVTTVIINGENEPKLFYPCAPFRTASTEGIPATSPNSQAAFFAPDNDTETYFV